MFNNSGPGKENNLTINYDSIDRPEEKILILLAFIGWPVNVTAFVDYANWKLKITDTGNLLTSSAMAEDVCFATLDQSNELTVGFNGKPGSGRYSGDAETTLKAVCSSPGMHHRLHWLPNNLTIDDIVTRPEFGLLGSDYKVRTLRNYFGADAAKFVASYYIRNEDNRSAREAALGRYNDIRNRRPVAWSPEFFLSEVELHMLDHSSKRKRTPETILAEIRETHNHLLALATELGNSNGRF